MARAKSTKHVEAVPAFDQFRAPWESEGGTDAEIDKPKLKRWIHNILVDKGKAQDSRDDAVADLEEVTAERDDFQKQAEASNGEEATKKIAKLEKQVADLTSERDELVSANEERDLRAKVLVGLPDKYAKRVIGKTEDELKASLKELAEDFDIPLNDAGLYDPKSGDDEDSEDEGQPVPVRRQPRTDLHNITDPDPDAPKVIDYDAVAASIVDRRVL